MKQAIAVRTDLEMSPGKLAAQVAHASLTAYERADDTDRRRWRTGGQKKVVLQATDESMLFDLADRAGRDGLAHAVIRDAGHTQLAAGTPTAVAIGPAAEAAVDAITGDLPLY